MPEGRRRASLLWLLGGLALAALVVVGEADDDDRPRGPQPAARGLTLVVERLCLVVGERREESGGAVPSGPGGRAQTASRLAAGVRRLGRLDDRLAVRVGPLLEALTAFEAANRLAQAGDVLADPLPVAREIARRGRALDAAAARMGAPSCATSSPAFGRAGAR